MIGEQFLSCDWGTTNVRLRRVDVRTGATLAEVSSAEGCRATFEGWRRKGGDRLEHFAAVLRRLLAELPGDGGPAPGVMAVSGMASSSIGMRELPYAHLPLPLDGSTLPVEQLPSGLLPEIDLWLLSGVRDEADVARGEETQVIGLAQQLTELAGGARLVIPGTHSKHLAVRDGSLRSLRTYMTGELFEAVSRHTVLASSVDAADFDAGALRDGVRAAPGASLLHRLFAVRTGDLFGRRTRSAAYWYLSGLLIGSELADLAAAPVERVLLCADGGLADAYTAALDELGWSGRTVRVPADRLTRAVAAGQLAVLRDR